METHPNPQHDDRDYYQTGSITPPKKHGGLFAVLLSAVILLGGIASALGISNIRLHRRLSSQPQQKTPLSFSQDEDTRSTEPADSVTVPPESRGSLDVDISPVPDPSPSEQAQGLSLREIYKKAIPSVVSISCTTDSGSASGTGVVLSRDGFLITNSHVIADANRIQVLFTDGQYLDAQVVGTDPVSDLAVLHVKANDLTPAEFGDSSSIQVGDLAVAIGDPLGLELRGTMTDGIISAINRDISTGGRTMTLLQTNAALNSGNSGGPLLNCYGQVVGINTMKIGNYTSHASVEGLGFAIPSTTVIEVAGQLIRQGYVSGQPSLGITGEKISVLYQHLYSLPRGVYITDVEKSSDAAAKGISPGDVLVSMDGSAIPDMDAYNSVLCSHESGDLISVIIYRSGKSYQLDLTVG